MGNLPRVPYEDPPPWSPSNAPEPKRPQEDQDRRDLAAEEQRRIDREAEQEDAS